MTGLKFYIIQALLVVLTFAQNNEHEKNKRVECLMWSKLENKTLPLQDQGHANCTTNEHCTGFDCAGIYQEKELSFGMRVLPCLDSPGVEIYGYAPQFNTKKFSHIFKHESEYKIPGELLNSSLLPGGGKIETSGNQHVEGRLEVHIQKNPDGRSLVMGLMMKICVSSQCILSKPVFDHAEIPVPECTEKMKKAELNMKKVGSMCSMNDLKSCGENQMCVQSNEDPSSGSCQCLHSYVEQDDRTCMSQKEDMKMNKMRKDAKKSTTPPPQPQVSEGSGGAAVAAGVVSVLVILALIGVGFFVVLRTRLAPRLRARLTNTPYEDIVIGKQGRSESTQNVIA